MVQSAIADVICPSVPTEDPDGFLHQVMLQTLIFLGNGMGLTFQSFQHLG